MIRYVQSQTGATLIITLAIVAVLSAAGLQLKYFVKQSATATRLERNLFQSEQIAMSGFELARLILTDDAALTRVDSIQESWADPEVLSASVAALGFGSDVLTLTIEDELSKIQVNALISEFPGNDLNSDQARLWEKISNLEPFKGIVKASTDPSRMVNPLKDWLDSGDDDRVTGLSGAESDYYQGLDPPYACANGPVDHLNQLGWIKGFGLYPEGNHVSDPDETSGTEIEWDRFFTVYGLSEDRFYYPGQVNINTAPVEVIRAILPEGRQDLAQDLVDYRAEKSEDEARFIHALDKGWVETIIGFGQEEKQGFNRIVTYSSHYFKVTCQVQYLDINKTWAAVLKREKDKISGVWSCRVIQVLPL